MFHRRADANIRSRNISGWTTTNILFICGGAFVGLEKIIQRRFGPSRYRVRHGGGIG